MDVSHFANKLFIYMYIYIYMYYVVVVVVVVVVGGRGALHVVSYLSGTDDRRTGPNMHRCTLHESDRRNNYHRSNKVQNIV